MSDITAVAAPAPSGTGALDPRIETQAAYALIVSKYVMWVAITTAILTAVLWVPFRQYIQLLVNAGVLVLVVVGAGLYPSFHRRGKIRAGITVLLGSVLATLFVDALLLPDSLPAIGIGYVLLIMMCNMLLGDRGSRWLTGVGIIGFAADVALSRTVARDWFPGLDERAGWIIGTLLAGSALLGAVVVVRIIIAGQENAYRESEQANQDIAVRAEAESRRRERLEAVVHEYVAYLTKVGQGNLSAQLSLDGGDAGREEDDPLLDLGSQLEETVVRLRSMIMHIREVAGNLSSATAEILVSTIQQASSAIAQSASISQVTATVDQIKAIAAQLVSRATQMSDAAQRTVEVSRAGQEMVQETINGMAEIKTRVDVIEENILTLSDRTQQIGEIIDTVNAIAVQSNMLALNAAVEAARAGEQGKGFAVVAEEVRSLADRSQQATAQVKAILSDIQRATNATGMATEEGKKGVDAGVRLVGQMGEAIDQMTIAIDESAQSSTQMVAGGQQQRSGMEQIADTMQNINQATVQSLSGTRQTELTTQHLNELAQELTHVVEQYQL